MTLTVTPETAQQVFTFYSDPSHGWLRVPRTLANKLGFEISDYSYGSARFYYLEEDCDMMRFCLAFKAKYGVEPRIRDVVTNQPSHVRKYTRMGEFRAAQAKLEAMGLRQFPNIEVIKVG
jgi:hypothetical protein